MTSPPHVAPPGGAASAARPSRYALPTADISAHHTKFELLTAALGEAHAGRPERAYTALDDLVDGCLRRDEPGDLQYFIFASAISKRLDPARGAGLNLYLQRFERPQIRLFNLLARHLPTVSLAGGVANEFLCRFVAARDEVTLLDVGIGTGQQEVALLHKLARRGALPEHLTVVAVEPSESSLRAAEASIAAVAARLQLPLTFLPVHSVAEALGPTQWSLLDRVPRPLVVLSAFAAHHIRDVPGAGCARDALFRHLRAHEPAALVLCEPNADHHTPDFLRRFEACWRHFGLTFDLINQLDLPDDDKTAMKMFFAREIDDIVANGEEARCERHEPVGAWRSRLARTGFAPFPRLDFARGFAHDRVCVEAHDGYVGLDYRDETLVAVLCATAGDGPSS